MDSKQGCTTPRSELAKRAREHYERVASAAQEWNSVVEKSIEAWENQKLTPREQEEIRNFIEAKASGQPYDKNNTPMWIVNMMDEIRAMRQLLANWVTIAHTHPIDQDIYYILKETEKALSTDPPA